MIVLSYDFWKRQFGGARDVFGKSLRVDNATLAVIGIAPPREFDGIDLETVDVWIPVSITQASTASQSSDEEVARTWNRTRTREAG